jgi:long-chain acyl-CoA synthetase
MVDQEKTLIDYFIDNVNKYGDRNFMTQPIGGESPVRTWSFQQVLDESKRVAAYLTSLELPPKSKIAIMSKNCSWWIMADLAILMAGHVSIPIFPTLNKDTTKFILEHSESKVLFIGKMDKNSWEEMKTAIPEDMPTISFPLSPEGCAKTKWDQILSENEPLSNPVKRFLDELCTIIYTSGSTGM